jgi:hypothetical protein
MRSREGIPAWACEMGFSHEREGIFTRADELARHIAAHSREFGKLNANAD